MPTRRAAPATRRAVSLLEPDEPPAGDASSARTAARPMSWSPTMPAGACPRRPAPRPRPGRSRAPHRLRHRHRAGRARGRPGARCAVGRPDLLAPGDRLQPADPCRGLDPRDQRDHRGPGQPRDRRGRAREARIDGAVPSPITPRSRRSSMPARGSGRPTVLIAMHSFTPVYMGAGRPWQIGLLYNRDPRVGAPRRSSCSPATPRSRSATICPTRSTTQTDYTLPVHGERRGLLHARLRDPPGPDRRGGRAGAMGPAHDAAAAGAAAGAAAERLREPHGLRRRRSCQRLRIRTLSSSSPR